MQLYNGFLPFKNTKSSFLEKILFLGCTFYKKKNHVTRIEGLFGKATCLKRGVFMD